MVQLSVHTLNHGQIITTIQVNMMSFGELCGIYVFVYDLCVSYVLTEAAEQGTGEGDGSASAGDGRGSAPGQWHRAPLSRTGVLPPIDDATRNAVLKSMCYGLFSHIARKVEEKPYFTTMEGNASIVFVHPGSMFFGNAEHIKWALFHQVVWTSKPYMRIVCPVKYRWVKYLLPKLRQVEVHALSSTGEVKRTALVEADKEAKKAKLAAKVQDAAASHTSESEVDLARQRYLERKKKKKARPI
eukprot:m.193731 g.193731  ORF g.193731 m.193731 type:complete len:243 (+) comp14882_c0_seq6:1863-2591(+)